MTRDDVIRMAREADLIDARDDESTIPGSYGVALEHFASLAAAAERERITCMIDEKFTDALASIIIDEIKKP